MVTSVDSRSSSSLPIAASVEESVTESATTTKAKGFVGRFFSPITGLVDHATPTVQPVKIRQRSNIEMIERVQEETPLTTASKVDVTNANAKKFIDKAYNYTLVTLIYNYSAKKPQTDDRVFTEITQELGTSKVTYGKIKRVMHKHFPQLAIPKIWFFYMLFHWLIDSKYWIEKLTTDALDIIRESLKKDGSDGGNLPEVIDTLLKRSNDYLGDYNKMIRNWKTDKKDLPANRDKAIEHQIPLYLDNNKTPDEIIADFAKIIAHDFIPKIETISHGLENLRNLVFWNPQTRPFKAIKYSLSSFLCAAYHIANFINKTLVFIISRPFALFDMIFKTKISYYIYSFLTVSGFEKWVNDSIRSYIENQLKDEFIPKIMKASLDAVDRPGFANALNTATCKLLDDFIKDLDEDPSTKDVEITPNFITLQHEQLFNELADNLLELLSKEPHRTPKALDKFDKHGLKAHSSKEKVVRWLVNKYNKNPKSFDEDLLYPAFVEAVKDGLINAYNFLSTAEKSEEYLGLTFELLEKVFDVTPDMSSPEGHKITEDFKEKRVRLRRLKDELIKKLLDLGMDNSMNAAYGRLSKDQIQNINVFYRKLKKFSHEPLTSTLKKDAKNLQSKIKQNPSDDDKKLAMQAIDRALEDFKYFEQSFENLKRDFMKDSVKTDETPKDPVCKEVELHLKPILEIRKTATQQLVDIKEGYKQIEDLKIIEKELWLVSEIFNSIDTSNLDPQLTTVDEALNRINKINTNHQYDSIVQELRKFDQQIKLIVSHQKIVTQLQKISGEPSLLNQLTIAHKELLKEPGSEKKQENLEQIKSQIYSILNTLPSTNDDIIEIKLTIGKILDTATLDQADKAYQTNRRLFIQNVSKYKSLKSQEQEMLSVYYKQCKSSLSQQIRSLPSLKIQLYRQMQENAQLFETELENLYKAIRTVEKTENVTWGGKLTDLKNRVNVANTLSLVAPGALAGTAAGIATGVIATPFVGPAAGVWLGGKVGVGAAAATSATVGSYAVWKGPEKIGKAASNLAQPITTDLIDSAYRLTINSTFYKGLFYNLMQEFSKTKQVS